MPIEAAMSSIDVDEYEPVSNNSAALSMICWRLSSAVISRRSARHADLADVLGVKRKPRLLSDKSPNHLVSGCSGALGYLQVLSLLSHRRSFQASSVS